MYKDIFPLDFLFCFWQVKAFFRFSSGTPPPPPPYLLGKVAPIRCAWSYEHQLTNQDELFFDFPKRKKERKKKPCKMPSQILVLLNTDPPHPLMEITWLLHIYQTIFELLLVKKNILSCKLHPFKLFVTIQTSSVPTKAQTNILGDGFYLFWGVFSFVPALLSWIRFFFFFWLSGSLTMYGPLSSFPLL